MLLKSNKAWLHACFGLATTLQITVILFTTANLAHAQPGSLEPFDTSTENSARQWQEETVKFPVTPRDADLLPFDDNAASTQRFAIDAKSLTLGQDDVVRYTIVSRSLSGARNVSYEGIRCKTYEKKLYASGRDDGSWSASRNDQWVPIRELGVNRQQASLANGYFCNDTVVAGNVADMLVRLRRQRTLNKDFMR